MKDHIRLTALKKLCALLEQETGVRVYRGRQVIGADVTLPCIVINETIRAGTSNTGADEGKTVRNDRVDLLLSGYVDVENVEHPIDVSYEQIVKIERAFNKIHAIDGGRFGGAKYKEWYNLGGLVSNFKYDAPVCHNPPDEVQSKSYFYIYFSFSVAYDNANPHAELD